MIMEKGVAVVVLLLHDDDGGGVCRFDPDRFQEESAKRSFRLLGFSGKQTCPELR